MGKYLQGLFPTTAVPALLLGLSSHTLKDLLSPSAQYWLGRSALGLLVVSAIVHIILQLVNGLVPRRFANLVYLLDDDKNVAMIDHPHHKRVQPPGDRLGYHEAPHEAVGRVVKEELGLDYEKLWFLLPAPPPSEATIGKVTIVPSPIQVQVERRKQRLGVGEHYDFVYLCRIKGVRPELKSETYNPRWLSLRELKTISASNVERAPFEDIIPTLERLIPFAKAAEAQAPQAAVG